MEYHPDMVCLLEPRVSGKKANCIIGQLGFNFSHRVEAVGFLGGIWVGWKESVRIQIIQNHPQFILLLVNDCVSNNSFFITFVYGNPNRSKRKILWEGLKAAMPPQSTPWILIGDFNAILDPEDKRSPCTLGKICKLFGNFVDSYGLQDSGYSGPKFTWQRGGTSVRLDRALANDAWMESFPQCLILNLPRVKSDHRPILLSTRTYMELDTGRPFRFLAGWTKHNNFPTFVKDKWIYGGNMAESLNRFTYHVKEWNNKVYRFLGLLKRHLMRSLNNIKKALDYTDSSFLARQEMEIRDELENEQAGFIAGRNIFDNIILHKKSSTPCAAKGMGKIGWLSSWIWRKLTTEGIQQECPLSPYLFVLCMDWLGHLIKSNIDIGRWEPIKLSRSGPAISHLFFADDLVIFCKAHIGQAWLLKSILDQFCEVSGHKISTRKSNIYFSKSIDNIDCDQVVNLFGFQEVQDLGFYLGVPLLHYRVTKSTFSFVVDKVRRKLNSWDVRKLSIARRVIWLIRSPLHPELFYAVNADTERSLLRD
ncbi:reverse transcriptase [Gossypium australe]|uniref:Reverse transcriptase n=1 Tax=Gossypium australe TaxID=47621 RepID=A0A5B6WZS3_9ROSI|nr:reverse transcriptase [Gossypium australe]